MHRTKLTFFLFILFLISTLFLSLTISTSVDNTDDTDTSSKKLVLIGDSITRSFYGSLYINNLSSMPYWTNLSMINSGYAGCSVNDFYQNEHLVTYRVSQYEPDFVLIFLGLADAAWFSNTSSFEIEYRWLLDTIIQQSNNECQLLLVKFSWSRTALTPFQESHVKIIEKIAQEYQLPFSDVYEHTKDKIDWFGDGTHPNIIGAYQIASCISDSFTYFINGALHSPVDYPTSSLPQSSSRTGFTSHYFLWISGLFVLVILKKTNFHKK